MRRNRLKIKYLFTFNWEDYDSPGEVKKTISGIISPGDDELDFLVNQIIPNFELHSRHLGFFPGEKVIYEFIDLGEMGGRSEKKYTYYWVFEKKYIRIIKEIIELFNFEKDYRITKVE